MRLLFLTAAFLASSLYAADPELLSLVMPDAQVVAGVNIEPIKLSPLGQYLLAQSGPSADAELDKLTAATGFDPRRDLKELLAASSTTSNQAQALILARGTFDVTRLVAMAEGAGKTVGTYKGISIIQLAPKQCVAFLDSTIAALGEEAMVQAAIDRKSAPTSIPSALAVQVNQLSITEDAWFVSLGAPPMMQGVQQGGGPAALFAAFFSKIQQVSGGVKLGANLAVTVTAVSDNSQDAASLGGLVKSLPALAQMAAPKGEAQQATAWLESLNVTTDGASTTATVSIPESQIEQMMPFGPVGVDQRSTPRTARPPQSGSDIRGVAPQRIRVGGNVQEAKLTQRQEPVYPPLALQARVQGVVKLNAIIGVNGSVEDLTLVSGHPLLVQPAMDAVKQWIYQKTLLNGQPVEVATQIEVKFELKQ